MRYIKPKSVSWWSGIAMIAAGVFMASEPVHGLSPWVETMRNIYNMGPAMLINAGVLAIGLRGAMGK